jgi:cathepsin C
MLESRLKILTNNTFNSSLSVQYLVSCSFYTEGCQGGFPTLLHKFIQEFGLVEEECMEYVGVETECNTRCSGKKVFVKDYYYVGGFYGASNEVNIMKEIRARGPVIIDLDPGNKFARYKEGVLKENSNVLRNELSGLSLREKMIPWEKVTHSVLLVGWGIQDGEKFWKCLNSWGEEWGENGYFRIRKGTDEDSIESMAEAAVPFVMEM